MEKKLPPVLETERLILRPLDMKDKTAIYQWASDPRVSKYMMYSNYNSPDDANFWLEHLYEVENQFDYGFVWKETGELIGSGGLNYQPENDVWNLGYNLRYDMWGKGIATEASKKIIEYAVSHCDVKRIEACHAIDNPASGKVMKKLGMSVFAECEYSKFDGSATFKALKYELLID